MKKYRVKHKHKKAIMNSNRMVTLKKGAVIHLKTEGQVKRLMRMGYLEEIPELEKREMPKKKVKVKPKIKHITPRKPSKKEEAKESKNKLEETSNGD